VEREQAQATRCAGNIIKRYLDVLDDWNRLKNRPLEGDGVGWANGIELIYRKLTSILETRRETMEARAALRPPTSTKPSPRKKATIMKRTIIEVLQQAISWRPILRPPVVRVAQVIARSANSKTYHLSFEFMENNQWEKSWN